MLSFSVCSLYYIYVYLFTIREGRRWREWERKRWENEHLCIILLVRPVYNFHSLHCVHTRTYVRRKKRERVKKGVNMKWIKRIRTTFFFTFVFASLLSNNNGFCANNCFAYKKKVHACKHAYYIVYLVVFFFLFSRLSSLMY